MPLFTSSLELTITICDLFINSGMEIALKTAIDTPST